MPIPVQQIVEHLMAVSVLVGTAVLASWIPARRAGRTDPLQTLKAE